MTRNLTSPDPLDYNFTLGKTFPMIWAEYILSPDSQIQHNYVGSFDIFLLSNGRTRISTTSPIEMMLHGYFMWVSWTLLSLVMLATNRWFSYLSDKMLICHTISGLSVLIFTIAGAALAMNYNDFVFSTWHTIFGWVVVVVLCLVSLLGMAALRFKMMSKGDTKMTKTFRKVHKAIALFVQLLAIVATTLGMSEYFSYHKDTPDSSLMVPLSLSFTIILFVGNEIYYQYWRRLEDPFIIEEFYPVITSDEFEERVRNGEKLVILDNLVLDITDFLKMHPGGSFLLQQTIGRDVSKFFYGGYALDGNSNDPSTPNQRHAHTNVARRIANRLVIALIDNRDI